MNLSTSLLAAVLGTLAVVPSLLYGYPFDSNRAAEMDVHPHSESPSRLSYPQEEPVTANFEHPQAHSNQQQKRIHPLRNLLYPVAGAQNTDSYTSQNFEVKNCGTATDSVVAGLNRLWPIEKDTIITVDCKAHGNDMTLITVSCFLHSLGAESVRIGSEILLYSGKFVDSHINLLLYIVILPCCSCNINRR